MATDGAFNPLQLDKDQRAAAIADAGSDPSINVITGTAYTALATDASRYTRFTNGSAVAFTIPKDVFQVGAELAYEQGGAGAVTPTAASGVTISARGAAASTAGQGAVAILKQVARNIWTHTGDIA